MLTYPYFISPIRKEAADVNAHNEEEQIMLKHPIEEKWAVRILPGNKYAYAKLRGAVADILPDDWCDRVLNENQNK